MVRTLTFEQMMIIVLYWLNLWLWLSMGLSALLTLSRETVFRRVQVYFLLLLLDWSHFSHFCVCVCAIWRDADVINTSETHQTAHTHTRMIWKRNKSMKSSVPKLSTHPRWKQRQHLMVIGCFVSIMGTRNICEEKNERQPTSKTQINIHEQLVRKKSISTKYPD